VTDATISASHSVWTGLRDWGSHPLLDPFFGTASMTIHHQGIETTRLQKAAQVGRWPEGLAALYVCEAGPVEAMSLNCGICEKCMRTRVELLIGAGIEDPPTFPPGPLTGATIEAMPRWAGFRRHTYHWSELAPAARKSGRTDLADAIDRLVRRQRAIERWHTRRGWRGALRKLDRDYLGGIMRRARWHLLAP
jgi:hypothetical protein